MSTHPATRLSSPATGRSSLWFWAFLLPLGFLFYHFDFFENTTHGIADHPEGIEMLLRAYPLHLESAAGNTIRWKDGTLMPWDDGLGQKTYDMLVDTPDLEDQVCRFAYPKGSYFALPDTNHDPGCARNLPFFKKMYGASEQEVRANLVPIVWLPKTLNQTVKITRINGVAERLQAISNELDTLHHLHPYLQKIGGTFNWRNIAATNRLSPHAFGIAIDINVKHSNYWLWDKYDGDSTYAYINRIPLEIVAIFEKHGFIWGGKWYHYDTMHFEYRPEILPPEE